jgi:hypothetical protein
MAISEEAVIEFKEIWKKEYGEDIGDAEACERGERLLQLYKAILDGTA